MKKALKLVLLVLVFGFVGVASAQHRGGYSGQQRGSYNNHDRHSGYNNGGYRHHGGYNWLAPLVIGAGVGYLVTRPYYVEPPVVYYEPLPRAVVPASQQQNNCHREERKTFDEKGVPLGSQVFLVCPLVATTAPPVVTQ